MRRGRSRGWCDWGERALRGTGPAGRLAGSLVSGGFARRSCRRGAAALAGGRRPPPGFARPPVADAMALGAVPRFGGRPSRRRCHQAHRRLAGRGRSVQQAVPGRDGLRVHLGRRNPREGASGQDKVCLLVIIGVRADGTKELVGLDDGYRDRPSRGQPLRDCQCRGMQPPVPQVMVRSVLGGVRDVPPTPRAQGRAREGGGRRRREIAARAAGQEARPVGTGGARRGGNGGGRARGGQGGGEGWGGTDTGGGWGGVGDKRAGSGEHGVERVEPPLPWGVRRARPPMIDASFRAFPCRSRLGSVSTARPRWV